MSDHKNNNADIVFDPKELKRSIPAFLEQIFAPAMKIMAADIRQSRASPTYSFGRKGKPSPR